MPSLFSRSRTSSSPSKKHSLPTAEDSAAFDEFGRFPGRLSNFTSTTSSPSPLSKKDKKKAKEQEKRFRTLSTTREDAERERGVESPLPLIPDGSFLPLNLERPRNDLGTAEQSKERDYGYLSYERHVVLGLEQVARLVEVVSEELETRGGVTTPFIFSTTALDISSSAIRRLIRTFLDTCTIHLGHTSEEAELRWREEARFAGPHELGMCLRWGLARIVRSVGGQDVRGLISWEHYTEFRESEAALNYPPSHFATFLTDLVPPLQSIIITVLTLLSRLTANSTTSGHTPPTLSPLFGPLLFGLGPATLAFHHTYIHYLRAVNAMEHILLAFIRWQDSPRPASNATQGFNLSGSAAALGVPTRLKEWIKGYPSMLPFLQEKSKKERPQARRGARTVRVMSVRRNVRMYSPDLVKTATTWAHRSRPGVTGGENGLASSKEWDRIAPATLKLPPRYSEAYKKRMDMPANFHPDTGSGVFSPGMSNAPSASSYSSNISAGLSNSPLSDQDYFGLGLGTREGEDRFRSLTDLKWGEFESMGFSGLEDEKKLQFDLTESARNERSAKRQTLSWNDFSSSGFTRSDAPLSATLQFSSPVSKTISSWPSHSAEMSKKLKKTQKALPAFGWDTEPVIGNEEVIEESFVDVFCDLVYGGGWMDLERHEELDRDCNWALIEFKSLPHARTTASGGSDPRTATTLILFEEFVPLEYRQQLAVTSSTRRRLPSLFSPSNKSKSWKQAATLNGRPYVVGHVPPSPSYREVEFEGLLRGGGGTKVISLGSRAPPSRITSTVSNAQLELPSQLRTVDTPTPLRTQTLETPAGPKSDEMHSDSTMSPSTISAKRSSRFRLPGGIPVPSPGVNRKTGIAPAEYSSVDFETRFASYSDDEHNNEMTETEAVKQKRRELKEDAWVDILVGTQNRRMDGQDAELTAGERRKAVRGRRSDPDMASMEVAQVLAAVRDRSPSLPSVLDRNDRVDRDYGMDHMHDEDVDEIETVPRTSGVRSEADTADYSSMEPVLDSEGMDDEVYESPTNQMTKQRRLGYFDLHPERRPQPTNPIDDDPRVRLAYDADSGDEADEDNISEPQPRVPPLRRLPLPPRETSAPDDIHDSKPESKAPPIDHATQNGNGNGNHDAKPITPSKTAALIEMYRERERGTPPRPVVASPIPAPAIIAPLQPSRLPIRSASLPNEGATSILGQPTVAPVPRLSPNPSPPLDISLEPPRVPIDETGRSSPARYVHGAPLHNVLEEEEEEE